MESTIDVDVDDLMPVLDANILQRAVRDVDASIIHQYVLKYAQKLDQHPVV